MILYLHGFRSSPQSNKAQIMQRTLAEQGLAERWCCPQLPPSPAAAIELCNQLIHQAQLKHPASELLIIGSSLGGYYAHVLAEQWGCKAALLNPAIHAARSLSTQVGTTTQYHSNEAFEFLAHYIDELTAMHPQHATQLQRYFLLAASGDEVLDSSEMVDYYAGSQGLLIFGSDHGISDFTLYLAPLLAFIRA